MLLLCGIEYLIDTDRIELYSTGSSNTPGFNPHTLRPKDPDRSREEPPGFWARMTTAVHNQKGTSIGAQKGDKKLWAVLVMLLLTNLPAAFYTSLIHQVFPFSLDLHLVLLVTPCPDGVFNAATY
jgi:hypothetical protein